MPFELKLVWWSGELSWSFCFFDWVEVFQPSEPIRVMSSQSVYQTTLLPWQALCKFSCQKLTTALLESVEGPPYDMNSTDPDRPAHWHSLIRVCYLLIDCSVTILKIYFLYSSSEWKDQLTRNLIGNMRVTCKSKIAKIVQIGNPGWSP